MDQVIHPYVLYALCVLGGVGVCLALPRRTMTPGIIGGIIAALAGGLLLIFMGVNAGPARPNLYFYIFALVALGGALRVITHPRPVYAALYFILTVIATAGLFLLLSAEFMAFALIIVYAGAILITYLFVIMLATQAPEEGDVEVLAEYDVQAREPIAASVVGFLLLALLTGMMFKGVGALPPPQVNHPDMLLDRMPRKVENALINNGLMERGGRWDPTYDTTTGELVEFRVARTADAELVVLPREQWPESLQGYNIEGLGFNFLNEHPGTIEIAGVILLMAMLGAVVLSRKQVQMDEEAKLRQSRALAEVSDVEVKAVSDERSPISVAHSGRHAGSGV